MTRLRFLRPTWYNGQAYDRGDTLLVEEESSARVLELRGDAQRVTDADWDDRTLPPAPSVEHRDPRPGRRRR